MADVTAGGTSRLRIVQLNIGSAFEPEWDLRRHEIVAWLRELQPDVVCLEEVCVRADRPNTAGWIVGAMPEAGWHWRFGGGPIVVDPAVHTKQPWPEGIEFGSAVLSRWPIDSFMWHPLPLRDDAAPFLRMVPWELVHARTAGLDVFATHLAAAPSDGLQRVLQVQAIDGIVRSTRGALDVLGPDRSSMPPILCGDFNAEPDSDEIRFLCGLTSLGDRTTFWQDAWRVAGDGGPGLTQDWRDNELASSLNVHRKRIDYVFVGDPFLRPGSGGRVLSAAVAFDTARTGVMASDHRGLVVDVVWPDRPS